MSRYTKRFAALVMVLALTGAVVGCGSDDDEAADGADTTEAASETTEATDDSTEPEATEPAASEPTGDEIVITTVDYEFKNVPESVPSGSVLLLNNESEEELHEMVVVRIPDTETRPVSELVELPDEEVEAILGSAPPPIVQLQAPGGEVIQALGDGTLTEPGRYAMVCFIPVGVPPQEYLDAAMASEGEPPEFPGAGPPHITQGMFTEFNVE